MGTKADKRYTGDMYKPCRERVDGLLKVHDGHVHDDVGDQMAVYFDHAQDAIQFAVALQRSLESDTIAVPDGCGCPHLQLHLAIGTGSMESDAYRAPGSVRVSSFGDVARVLAVTVGGQILVMPDAYGSAGRIDKVTTHTWEVVLPKEQEQVTVLELLWDGRKPAQPNDLKAIGDRALQFAGEKEALVSENSALKASLTAALERVQTRADTGDAQARGAIDQARRNGDLSGLDAALDAECDRRETEIKAQAAGWIELCRESATVAYLRGDIDKAKSRLQSILRFLPDDLDVINRLGHIHYLRGQLSEAEESYRRLLVLAADDQAAQAASYGNLGNVLQTRGDLDGAEAMHRKALAINEKLGRPEGIAKQYGNLGIVLRTRGDLDRAEAMHRKALEIEEKLGRREGMASHYANLGIVLEIRGDLDGARDLWMKSRDLFARLGARQMVDRVQGWIDRLPPAP